MAVDTIRDVVAGVTENGHSFHIDALNDVLYLRLPGMRQVAAIGEETAAGYTLLQSADGRLAGVDIVNFWRDNGTGSIERATPEAIESAVSAVADRVLRARSRVDSTRTGRI